MSGSVTLAPSREQELQALVLELVRYARGSQRTPERTQYLGQLTGRALDDVDLEEYGYMLGRLAGFAGDLLDQVEKLSGVRGDELLDVLESEIGGDDA